MLTYLQAWIVFAIYRKLRADPTQHTQFRGWPLLTHAWVRSDNAAYAIEAVLVFAIGCCLYGWSPAVGQFVIYGSFALAISCVLESAYIARRKEATHDAIVEMEFTQGTMSQTQRNRR